MHWKYPFAKMGNFVDCIGCIKTSAVFVFVPILLSFCYFEAWTFISKYPSKSLYFSIFDTQTMNWKYPFAKMGANITKFTAQMLELSLIDWKTAQT